MIDTTQNINELIDKYPSVIPILMRYGINCVSCPFSKWDNLEIGLRKNGIEDEYKVNVIISALNEAINNQ